MYLTSWFCISHSQGISNKSPQGLHIMLKFQQNHNLPHGQLMLIFSSQNRPHFIGYVFTERETRIAQSIKFEIQWTKQKVISSVCQFGVTSPPECWGFGVELRRSLYILPIAWQLQLVKVFYRRFECSFPRSKFGSSSRPEIRSSTIQIFHLLRFRSSSMMMITSPLAKGVVWFMCFIRCRSLNPCKYSVVHLVHKVCFRLRRYLALQRRSNSLRWCGSSSASWFDRRNESELAVSTDNSVYVAFDVI